MKPRVHEPKEGKAGPIQLVLEREREMQAFVSMLIVEVFINRVVGGFFVGVVF